MKFRKLIPVAAITLSLAAGVLAAPSAQAISGGVSSRRPEGAVQLAHQGQVICGGTLVSQRFVVTARHCFYDDRGNELPLGQFQVNVGNHVRGQGEHFGVCRKYARIGVVTGGDQAQGAFSDIMVIQLNRNVGQTNQIVGYSGSRPVIGSTVSIRGWGQSGDLRVANMRVNAFNVKIDAVPDGMELRQATGISQKGDSGGPVLQGGQLVGVISEGESSPPGTIAVEVARYHDWIAQTLQSRLC